MQDAYDAVLPTSGLKVRRYRYYEASAGIAFKINSRHAAHPFLKGLSPDSDHTCIGNYWSKPWFPTWYSGHASIYNTVQQRTHSGAFLAHGSGWLPLLSCSATGFPIMLVSAHGKGAVIATTMHLASSGQTQLLSNMLTGWRRGEATELQRSVAAYHEGAALGSKARYWIPRAVPQFALVGGLYWLGYHYYSHLAGGGLGFAGWWLSSILGSKYYDDLAGLIKSKVYKASRHAT